MNQLLFKYVIVFLSLSWALASCNEAEKEMISPQGGYQDIQLKDGTLVKLGPESKALYKESSNEMKVEGEAILKVASGKSLSVTTPNGIIVAQSGDYRIHSRRTTMIAFAMDGSAITSNIDGGAERSISGGMYSIYNGKNLAHVGDKAIEQMTNDKYWVFNSASLKFVMESIAAQYGITFDYGEADLNKVFSGFVPRNDIQIALSIVIRSLGLEYQEENGVYTLTNSSY